jgi:hypothetical protein
VNIKLYVEGAARHSDFDRAVCRQAFSEFFAAAGLQHRPRTVPCGGRQPAYDAFVTAVKTRRPGELPLLLVDSETPMAPGMTKWRHLQTRPGDNWNQPEGAGEDQVFLMVQVMETWLIADREALQEFFKPNFKENKIPVWPQLEHVSKAAVYDALAGATAECGQKKYSKGQLSFQLLKGISPAKVEAACPHAKALFDRLRNL